MDLRPTRLILFVTAFATVLAFATVPVAHAGEADQATLFRFSGPVRIPGQVLPAGSYWFVLMDRGANPEAVQIFEADHMTLLETICTADAWRMKVTGDTELTLTEPGGDSNSGVPAIKKWF